MAAKHETTTNLTRDPRPADLANRTLSIGILAGGVIAASAFLGMSNVRAPSAAGTQIVLQAPASGADLARTEPRDAATATELMSIAEPQSVTAERPVVALAHDDTETDLVAQARDEVEAGKVEEALGSLRRHLYRSEPTVAVLLEVGRLARQVGQPALAEQALLDAAALEPKSSEAQLELARSLLDAGDLAEARVHARQAIRLDPESAAAWNVAGRVAMQESAWARAEAAFRRAVELEPMNAMIHNNLGLLYIYTNRADDAVDSLETAVELFDDRAPFFVLNNLGLAHEKAGELDEARESFERALVVNPTYARAKVNLERVSTALARLSEEEAFDTASGPEPQAPAEDAPAL